MYITDIFIKNFQSHENSHIVLKPGVNCITGTSESGKSSILRAINFVFYNRFPSKFIQFGKNSAQVKIVFNNGNSITKIKGDTNKILLNYATGETKEFVKFGHETPEEVKKFLGSPPMDSNNDPIAYASQFDSYFLINSGPTELPRSISHIIGISNLEESSTTCSKKKKEYERSLKSASANIERQENSLKLYDNLEFNFNYIKTMEEKLANLKKIETHVENIQPLIDKYCVLKDKKTALAPKIEKINLLLEKTHSYKTMQNELENILKIRAEILKYKTCNNKINNIKVKKFEVDKNKLNFVQKSFKFIIEKNEMIEKYNSLLEKRKILFTQISDEKSTLENIKKDHEELIENLKVLNLWCDSCNRPIL